MKFSEAMQGIFYKTKGFLSKNAPTILAVTGVATMAAAGVIAVIKAPEIKAKIDDEKKRLDDVKRCLEAGKSGNDDYTVDDAMKDTQIIKARSVATAVKGYAPYVGMAAAGATMIFVGNHINNKRIAASVAAYTTLAAMFKKYRDGVIEQYGPEIDAKLRSGKIAPETKEESSDEKATSGTGAPSIYSDYGRIFDETNPHFKRNPTFNKFFLDSVEREANDKLRIRGYLFLNEVYDALGYEPTAAGQVVGWVYDKSRGDGYISFGHNNQTYESSCQFLAGMQPEVILDFNVDGPILDHFGSI